MNEWIFNTKSWNWTECIGSQAPMTESGTYFISPRWSLKALLTAQLWYTICYFLVKSLPKDLKVRKTIQSKEVIPPPALNLWSFVVQFLFLGGKLGFQLSDIWQNFELYLTLHFQQNQSTNSVEWADSKVWTQAWTSVHHIKMCFSGELIPIHHYYDPVKPFSSYIYTHLNSLRFWLQAVARSPDGSNMSAFVFVHWNP